MLVLALDTSTPAITAAVVLVLSPHEVMAQVAADGAPPEPIRLLAEQVVIDAFGHAEKVLPLVTAVLAEARCSLTELDAVVVGSGPGPFTGLRVGIVTAAALGDALDIPAHPVPSHDGAARSLIDPGALVVVTDARRREVYLSVYGPDGRRTSGPQVVAPAAVGDLVPGAEDAAITGAGVHLVPGLSHHPRVDLGSVGTGLVRAAARELVTGTVPGPLTPLYLRRPDVSEPAPARSTLGGPSPRHR